MTKEEIKIRNYLIEMIEQETDDDKLQKDCRQLLRLGKKAKDDKAIGNAYFFLGWNDMKKGRYRKAVENVQEAMPYLKKGQEYEYYIRSFNIQGISYSELGNETLALESYLDGMENLREYHVPDLQVWFYNNIGSRFQEANDHKEAILYLDKARKYFSVGKRRERFPYLVIMIVYMNLGNSYTYTGEYEKGEEALTESMRIAEENGDDTYQFSLLCLKSTLYWRTGRRDYAYEHLDELVDMAGSGKSISDYRQNITEFVDLLADMKEYEQMKRVIGFFEAYAKRQDSVYLSITAIEFWLFYYNLVGDEVQYQKYALEYAKLSLEQKKQMLADRVQVMKLKIELKERELERKNAQKREEKLKRKSEKDALTGLGNRYFLERYSKQLITRAAKEESFVGIGVLDIDCFKQYNDTYGHLAGDKCLKSVADIIEEKAGEKGKCFRYGGDEFVILLENITETEIIQIAGEIKQELDKQRIANRNSVVKKTVTLSQGYAHMKPEQNYRLNQLLECADAALYAVKESGRDNYKVVNL